MSSAATPGLSQAISAQRRRRDRLVTVAINAAGIGVIGLLVLMLVYLLATTLPLAEGVGISEPVVTDFDAETPWVVAPRDAGVWRLPALEPGIETGCAQACRVSGARALRYADNRLYLYDLALKRSLEADQQPPIAQLERVLEDVRLGHLWQVHSSGEQMLVAGLTPQGTLRTWFLDPFGELHEQELRDHDLIAALTRSGGAQTLLLDVRSGSVLLVAGNRFLHWRLPGHLHRQEGMVGTGTFSGVASAVRGVGWGPDRETLLLADDSGRLHRFDAGRGQLPSLGSPQDIGFVASHISSEHQRRVTYLLSDSGALQVLAPASGQRLFTGELADFQGAGEFAVTGDGSALVLATPTTLRRYILRNRYPETGWRALWSLQWFSRYEAPAHVWHPDGAAISVLPKFGLSPLLFGTFKAALYGMLLAIPLALGSAIYTGYFLSSRVRNRVKPAIEMLEAFPTVVLGFIAGLWLAPLLADYLALILLLPLLVLGLPLLLALTHLGLQVLSPVFAVRPPRAWLVAIGYVLGLAALLASVGDIEKLLFQGSLRDWLWREFEIHYEQRNALLVGLAMGLALTPTLFSIIEDAIHAVPSSLSDAGLALGATRWQSLAQVVLPAASPAIVSAMLIGLSRGLGETMIVLLASGNTPLMEPGLFSGLRSISASIASELPEAGPGTVHFRLLFLAALVLFALTFVFNTIAELFRQRLRYSYAGR